MKKRIKKIIRRHSFLIWLWSQYQYCRNCLNQERYLACEINEALNNYRKEKLNDKEYIRKTKKDILKCTLKYKIIPKEFFMYDFEKRNDLGRSEFVGQGQLDEFWRAFSRDAGYINFEDKVKCYEMFRPYYGREILKVEAESDYDDFCEFTERHKKFIVKPFDGTQGKGVDIIEQKSLADLKLFFIDCINNGGAVLEEMIVQSEEMARFHPSSVNTIRFMTFYHEEKIHKIYAVIRMGRNGSSVDNAHAGGIYATIDMNTGIVNSPGRTLALETYLFHPDTNVQIIGAKIPKWEELNLLIEKVISIVPNQKPVGWDLALTKKGWIIVEGNSRPGIQLFMLDKGLKKRLQCIYDVYYEYTS